MDTDLAALVGALAARQDGCATIAQALRLGVMPHEVDSELRAGRWFALLRGTYLVDADLYAAGVPERTWWRAALLAHGCDTCLVAGHRRAGVRPARVACHAAECRDRLGRRHAAPATA